jgi:hypothetical protein
LFTTDILQVYDESVGVKGMGAKVWNAALWLGMVLGAMGTGTHLWAQNGQPAASGAPTAPGMQMDKGGPVAPSGPLRISFGDKSSEWTPAILAALPHKAITVFNAHVKANQTYSGVELIDLLKPLGVPEKPHGKDFRIYLIAEGSDGYQVVYSLGEVNPDVHDATVLVADAMDGKPLGAAGPLQLVATGEKRAARWVRNLVAIRVITAD